MEALCSDASRADMIIVACAGNERLVTDSLQLTAVTMVGFQYATQLLQTF
jgi:hypothetical protein